jgi:hypothetical protein
MLYACLVLVYCTAETSEMAFRVRATGRSNAWERKSWTDQALNCNLQAEASSRAPDRSGAHPAFFRKSRKPTAASEAGS